MQIEMLKDCLTVLAVGVFWLYMLIGPYFHRKASAKLAKENITPKPERQLRK
jgi:hypothetical protein